MICELFENGAKSFVVNRPKAVAAMNEDGTVKIVTSNCNREHTRSSEDELHNAVCVHTIFHWSERYSSAAMYSSAALRRSGSVVTWGRNVCGSARKDLLSGVRCLQSALGAFAAIKQDGRIITWGRSDHHRASNLLLKPSATMGAVCLVGTKRAFAAIQENGSAIAWGDPKFGGDTRWVSEKLQTGVILLCSNEKAIAALKNDGSVYTWGHSRWGGCGSSNAKTQPLLESGVIDITATSRAFAALKQDGSVVTWGSRSHGADTSAVDAELQSGVTAVFANCAAFAALKQRGQANSNLELSKFIQRRKLLRQEKQMMQ
eukprot:12404897-Karenia_brevis.AAC.1